MCAYVYLPHVREYARACVCACVYVDMCVHMCVCMCAHVCECVYMHIGDAGHM